MQSCGTMCHSENRYGDKQNKNRWWLQNCGYHLESKHIYNREKPLDFQFMDCIIYKVQTERKDYYNVLHLYGLRDFYQCFYSVYCPIVGIVLLCCTILFVSGWMSRTCSRKANLKQIDWTHRVCQQSGVFMVFVKASSD